MNNLDHEDPVRGDMGDGVRQATPPSGTVTGARSRRDKTTDLATAIDEYVADGASVAFGGMGGRDPEAAAREIVRQEKTGLTVLDDARTTLFDIMVGAGCVDRYTGSWVGTSLISQGFNVRRAVEEAVPHHLEMRDLSNFGSSLMFLAGAMDVPFVPTRSMVGTDIPNHNPDVEVVADPLGSGDDLALVPAAQPDVAIIHVQRADPLGNAQIWGNVVNDHLKARAADHVVITCEEVVPTETIRRHPEATRIPCYAVDAVVEVPFGSHPWHCYGYYYADLPFYREYGLKSQEREGFLEWTDEWVVPHEEYLEKLGADRLATLEEMEGELNDVPPVVGRDEGEQEATE
ncbi:CoA transferase subunit A [Halobellus marinus]|uniref:CoA transferase subunit A n=1 Tax=Halobellus TaxID=1073986 RepID=UPI0028AFA2AF|nr:CoA-transferase [Halobellus sp. DFY28]